jgi:hypothetical protein
MGFVTQLARAYKARLSPNGPTEAELKARIRVVDANELCQFLRGRRPRLSRSLGEMLGIQDTPGTMGLEDWVRDHAKDRPPAPAFVRDPDRDEMIRTIADVIASRDPDRYNRILWIVGPPGIGKTRLVLEALRRKPIENRVLVALGWKEGLDAILVHGIFERYRRTIFIIDDCPADQFDLLAAKAVQLDRDPDAVLIVLTPGTMEGIHPARLTPRLEVGPLSPQATEAIIRARIGDSSGIGDASKLAKLTEGFPWFAALVAAEVAEGAPLPKTVAEAADMALASGHEDRWHEVVRARARALFAVMLTEDANWNELNDEQREELARAVDAPSWHSLWDAYNQCMRRGLVRLRAGGKFKYVTPEILAREVARKLLTPPPNGPEPIGRRLKSVPQWARSLYERLERLGLSTSELSAIAGDVVRQIHEAGPGLSAFGWGAVPRAALLLAAKYAHLEVAILIRRRIEDASIEELRTRKDVRRDLVWALESIARREGGFDDAESALFRLAQAENETWGNNATNEWKSLFFVGVNPTRSPWEERIERLSERCREGTFEARKLALVGVDAALTQRAAISRPEGEPPPTRMGLEEARDARTAAWRLLIDCVIDEDPSLALEAQELVAKHLRDAVREGLLHRFVHDLIERLPRFGDGALRKMRESVEHAQAHDWEYFARSPAQREALHHLTTATEPRSYGQRLRQQVGAWPAGMTDEEEATRDEHLAREGLSFPDRPLLGELDWLFSEAAVRCMPFAIAVGHADTERIVLGPLLQRARVGASPDVLSAYCAGMSDVEDTAKMDAMLARWMAEPGLAEAIVLTVVRVARKDLPMESADHRARLVIDVLRHGKLRDAVFRTLTWGSWSQNVGSETMNDLLDALLEQPSQAAAVAALELVLRRLEGAVAHPDLQPTLVRVMDWLAGEDLAGMAAHVFERGGKHLLHIGFLTEASRLAVRGVLASDQLASEGHWDLMKACEERAPNELWEAVRIALERDEDRAHRLALDLAWSEVGSHFPADRVLAWVGRDHRRGLLAAVFTPMRVGELPDVARGLISRFGAKSPPARELASSLHTTYGFVPSVAEFVRLQLASVQHWFHDPDPQVRAWATTVSQELERSEELHAAEEEHERRRFGT